MALTFKKMHGLGNDFVVIDAQNIPIHLDAEQVIKIADRHLGVGCDQVLIIDRPDVPEANVKMRVLNVDGFEAEMCGNGARCVAYEVLKSAATDNIVLQSGESLLKCTLAGDKMVSVDMGKPILKWDQIPLAQAHDLKAVPINVGPLETAAVVSMGNPHAVFFVEDLNKINVAKLGPQVENHSVFPQRTNVQFAQVMDKNTVRLKIWERSAGITQACGSGACATVFAGHMTKKIANKVTVQMDGGDLAIEITGDGRVIKTGPVAYVFEGVLNESVL